MEKTFLKLFTEVAHAVEILSEKVMEYNKSKQDTKGFEAAEKMREEYSKLYDTLRAEDFNENQITRQDVIRILIGSIIIAQNLESQREALTKSVKGYKDTISKLQEIVDNSTTDDEAKNLLEKTFPNS
jgi:hypothetical protein